MKTPNWILKIKWFLLCLLQTTCQYSIKKVLAFWSMALVTYLAIWTTKDYLELLTFTGVLIGIRAYQSIQNNKNDSNNAA